MWTYIIRRLLIMIPTLFGVTIVTFVIMQMAPGDPMLLQLSAGGAAGESGNTREAFLIQKRDLKLDKPLLLNFRYFENYREPLIQAAWVRGHTEEQIVAELDDLAKSPSDEVHQQRLEFFNYVANRHLPWWKRTAISMGLMRSSFSERLRDPKQRERLATALRGYVQVWCEDTGQYAVPEAMSLLQSEETPLQEKIGLIDCLNFMVVEPLQYTYSRDPTEAESKFVLPVWETWWSREKDRIPPLDPDRRALLRKNLDELVAAKSRSELFKLVEHFQFEYFWDYPDLRFFAETLLGDSSFEEKVICAMILKLFVANPLPLTVPLDADAEQVQQVTENWLVHYEPRKGQYEPGLAWKLWSVVADTQYAHMLWRLTTFQFGRSALRTREPVSEKIWSAVKVSAPLMFMSGILIYVVAIPLGLICGVYRARWPDKLISLGLFLLYSVPAFVAGMLFLLYLSYGEYLKIFPMERLHSDGADEFGFVRYLLDYLWHATLPVICLSLFSLAPLAMYSRASLLEVLGQDFIRTARAKGLPESRVILVHALRNSMIPLITLFASFLPALLGGSVIIEYLFNIPGMGRLGWESILLKDIPTVMALVYIDAIVVMLSILLTDLLYVFVDPRITFAGQRGS